MRPADDLRESLAGPVSRWRWLGVVFLVALVWRVIYLLQIRSAPFFAFHIGDAAAYDAWAREIAAGNWWGQHVFYQSPLYPYALAVVYRLLGGSRTVVVIVQSLLSATACVLIGEAGWRAFSKSAGILAGLLLAVYPPAIFFDGLIQKSSLDLFLASALIWLTLQLASRPCSRWSLLTGIVAGLLALNRENALAPAAVIALWICWPGATRRGRRLSLELTYVAGLALVLLPVAARNEIVGGEFHLTTSQFGPNFFIGNHDGANGSYVPLRPGHGDARFERIDATRLAEQARGRPLSPGEVSDYWAGQALDFIRSQPAAWLRLMARKSGLFWSNLELTDTEDIYTYAAYSWTLRFPGRWLTFGVLAPLAVVGLILSWKQHPGVPLLAAMIAAYFGSVVLFYVVARYRFPVVPCLALLAARGVTGLPALFRTASLRRIVVVLGSAAAMALVCFCPRTTKGRLQAATWVNFGAEFADRGERSEALQAFQRAVAFSPGFAEAHYNLGTAYISYGRLREATQCFARAQHLEPGFVDANLNLGNVWLDRGDPEQAIAWFQRTLQLDPREARAWNGLGMAYLRLGDAEKAIPQFERALTLDPQFELARGGLEAARGMLPGAESGGGGRR